ncbi:MULTISPECIES: MaoC/PaaZ C-terminal domain-containing protein [Pseudonocardia]|uniref:MaoC like domain protein n=2 Tax=Pseudonocardia TaxID=1847 RepID=A0A1Y2MLB6_PSEAH|nr:MULTISPECIES: MaoC/PaaZ C-terminal domain-containing protein [Pseudonocardia]OSY35831.1 MaoC like domain protein [Pseudonocardia autotrophica]TDN73125.1 acyl dehydratase [Pseudonocardia autotrophica]BBG03844.1 3-alpha,7-alpha,12-alpha-trihydroxy-5-beta-choles t-24-enoyl-CoA hydratase [Pseudonocardia autotrophica]GEC27357.1 3-alpha,7-alpha,12-alpha-trihydroxy-5-beta-choles t-24-enoyl-CoA hydratase [Pseudonocardia saturnea]
MSVETATPLDVDALEALELPERFQDYTEQTSALYALGIGFGADPLDPQELRYVYEKDMRTVPTMAAVLCHPGRWAADPRTGITTAKVVHGEQRTTVHAPLPAAGRVRGTARIAGVEDKGPGRGALVHLERTLHDAATGTPLVTILHTSFCRADGGAGRGFGIRPQRAAVPDRAPDAVAVEHVRPDAALLYRLNADLNPLHVDPDVARAAGFDRPILHGMCTYGLALHAITRTVLGGDVTPLRSFDARFSGTVLPGETLAVEIWREPGALAFRARVPARNTIVLDNGRAEVSDD